jgi:1,4-dihydroxy-2-naphthoyl-CoA hydrolase
MDTDATDVMGSFADYLGLKFTELERDRVVIAWEAGPKHHQPHGIVHGGVHCSVVETAASVAASLWLGDTGRVVGVNNNTDFFRAVVEGEMQSVATPIHRGRSQQVWVVETTEVASGRLVSRGQVRLQNLYPDPS